MITDINSEDRLVQRTFADYLETHLRWDTCYAYNTEVLGRDGTLGRASETETVLVRDLRAALTDLNRGLPASAVDQAVAALTAVDSARSLLQHNRDMYRLVRDGVPVQWLDDNGQTQQALAQVIDFCDPARNRFLAVRELWIRGVRIPYYRRRADLVCFVNGLPLVFIELKATYRNIRAGFDDNLTDYLSEHSIAQAFHHNAFLVVSNGDRAKYGSITSGWDHFAEWKRTDEGSKSTLDAKALLDGMLEHSRLLDLVENFVLFDDSRAGGMRKIVGRNQQVLGVNRAVDSVLRQEALKREFPVGSRVVTNREWSRDGQLAAEGGLPSARADVLSVREAEEGDAPVLPRKAHPDLGRLGVFWHTQGSGKSYSMAFFAEKVRRVVPGNFTFVVVTDRDGLDDQLFRTFVGCAVADEQTPRAASGLQLKEKLGSNDRFLFTLIQKFNQPVDEPYSERDDIIVILDEAHRTQTGKFARNMRLALPNASFIGFTGTPLFKNDEITRRVFGDYISRYDFKRSEEDGSTVKLVYDNRGEKLGIARLDLNDRIAEVIEAAELDPDQVALLERQLGRDYEIITADERLMKIADDFVEHCSIRWQTGKSLLVCIDKITCARMFQLVEPRWRVRTVQLKQQLVAAEELLSASDDAETVERLTSEIDELRDRISWMEQTIIEIIISEAQNEVRDFAAWDFDIIPHRMVMKAGFETDDGRRVDVEDAFRDPRHPFRVAIVCAMWLTGFDVECLATLYIDKPMKAHTLMQAIARANRVYPGKECGVIVDYNGMLKSLRAALAQYALGDENEDGGEEVVAPIEELVAMLREAIEATERHLADCGFDYTRLTDASGFDRIEAFSDAVNALYSTDETKRKFEILARQVFGRFNALLVEPAALAYAVRHDNIETIYKKLLERRDTADVTAVLKELHRIVNEAIRADGLGGDHADGLTVDLSQIDFAKLRDEFAKKVKRKNTVVEDIREVVEKKLAVMLERNPTRMDYYKKYQAIIADYNREKDRATVEETFARLLKLAGSLDEEQMRAAEEGLTDDELALFDLLFKEGITKSDREKLKQASHTLLARLRELLRPMHDWTQNAATQAEVRVAILDGLWGLLPRSSFDDTETELLATRVYDYVWERSMSGQSLVAA